MLHGRPSFEDLVALASGELPTQRANAVAAAAQAEPELAATLQRLQQAIALLRSDDAAEPSADATARTKATLRRLLAAREATDAERGRADGPWWLALLDRAATLLFDSRDPSMAAGYRVTHLHEGELTRTRQLSFRRGEVEIDRRFPRLKHFRHERDAAGNARVHFRM